MKALFNQLRVELELTARRGESVLLIIGIPMLLLAFFSKVDVLPQEQLKPIDFVVPGIFALAIMSTSMVGLAIATGFERQYGVLHRLGATPLGRGRLITAKMLSVGVIQLVQITLLALEGTLLGWRPTGNGLLTALLATLFATAAFSGIGLAMAGSLKAEMVLAAANGFYLILLLISGMVFALDRLPALLADSARVLPSTALANIFRATLSSESIHWSSWPVLVFWSLVTPWFATKVFRWR